MDTDMIIIGNRIRERRKELHLTQTDIYHKCGIASGALSQIENGSRTPSVIIFYNLSKALDCSMEWLATGISSDSENFIIYEHEKTLLGNFRKLPEEEQEELMKILDIKLEKISDRKQER